MPAFTALTPLLARLLASSGGKAAAWILNKVGLGKVTEWAAKAIEGAVSRIGQRHKAVRKARHTIEGRWAPVIVEDRTRWVVFSGDIPIEIFPSIKGNLNDAMRTFDRGRLRDPDEITTARTRRWIRTRLARIGGDDDREDAAEASPTAEAVLKVVAEDGHEGGQALFHQMIEEMPELLDRLSAAPARTVAEHDGIPEKPGVYVFSEGVTPVYVGQSRNLRSRLRQHTSSSSRENQAALAWRIAHADAKAAGHAVAGTRKDLEADPTFAEHFATAKRRVAAMTVRFIELDDPVPRTVFEVYAARALGTDEFNTWETH